MRANLSYTADWKSQWITRHGHGRNVPRWLAALFVIGLGVAEFMTSAGIIVVLYMLPFAAAMVLGLIGASRSEEARRIAAATAWGYCP
jgi:hypothetical protein